MRPFRALVIYIATVFIGGALLAPWLYWLAQPLARAFPDIFHHIAAAPFPRFLDRSFLILALLGLWPLLRALGAVSWREIGLVSPSRQEKKFIAGLLLGLVSLAVVAGIALTCRDRALLQTATAHTVVAAVFNALVTAALVGTMEEILFRGGIFGGLRRLLYWPLALAISSAVYALLHFLQHAALAGAVAWNSGLTLLPRMLAGFADFRALVPGFFTLTLAGALLALAYQRTGNLYFSIGLHAGWIFVLKIYGALTVQTPGAGTWFWGTAKMFDGWLAFFAIAAMLASSKFLIPGQKRTGHATQR
jgi:CAAX protease family protein